MKKKISSYMCRMKIKNLALVQQRQDLFMGSKERALSIPCWNNLFGLKASVKALVSSDT